MKADKLVYIVFALMVLCVLLLIRSDSQPAELKSEVGEGKLYCFTEDKQYWSRLTDWCVKEDCLYVLFGDVGVLKVYDQNGAHIKSYAFWKTKGASLLRIDDEYVYLIDQRYDYYTFLSGEFIDYIGYSDYGTYLQKMAALTPAEDQRETDGARYYMKLASIYRESDDGSSVQVIHRPVYLMFFQGVTPFVVIAFCLAVLWMLKLLSGKRH